MFHCGEPEHDRAAQSTSRRYGWTTQQAVQLRSAAPEADGFIWASRARDTSMSLVPYANPGAISDDRPRREPTAAARGRTGTRRPPAGRRRGQHHGGDAEPLTRGQPPRAGACSTWHRADALLRRTCRRAVSAPAVGRGRDRGGTEAETMAVSQLSALTCPNQAAPPRGIQPAPAGRPCYCAVPTETISRTPVTAKANVPARRPPPSM